MIRESIQAESNDQLKSDYNSLKKRYDDLNCLYLDIQQKLGLFQQENVDLADKNREQ